MIATGIIGVGSCVLGAGLAVTGIILGNMGIWRMTDEVDNGVSRAQEMFATEESTNPRTRSEKVQIYRAEHKYGPHYEMLKTGQRLTVIGLLVVLLGGIYAAIRS